MKSSDRSSHIGLTQLGWKAFWLAMLVMHGPPILAALHNFSAGLATAGWGSGDLVRLVGLFGSAAFFFLKMVDVRWLRTVPTWRSRTAACVIVALLHAGVMERSGVTDATSSSAQLGLVVLVAVSVKAESVRSLLARFGRIRSQACNSQPSHNISTQMVRAFELLFLPYESLYSYGPTAPRAPPVC